MKIVYDSQLNIASISGVMSNDNRYEIETTIRKVADLIQANNFARSKTESDGGSAVPAKAD